jgi:hypothetical protein
MAARDIVGSALLIALLIAPAASCGPVLADEPPAEMRIITFPRNEKGEATGLSFDYGRVRGVRFTKR